MCECSVLFVAVLRTSVALVAPHINAVHSLSTFFSFIVTFATEYESIQIVQFIKHFPFHKIIEMTFLLIYLMEQ